MVSDISSDNLAPNAHHYDVIVVGAGISGVCALKYCKEWGLNCVLLESTDAIGGLWTYREKQNYGAMSFTHINVSKYNYCFSDVPFHDEDIEYAKHSTLSNYITKYCETFQLLDSILLKHRVTVIQDDCSQTKWRLTTVVNDNCSETREERLFTCDRLLIATGHHVTPKYVAFDGLETFSGKVIHSCEYKNGRINGLEDGKRVLVVGIGNSAVDIATDLANCNCDVYLSTRSGAWIIPNYIMGYPTDLYASRFVLWLPWWILNKLMEAIVWMIFGSPFKWNLNPKMNILQTQPTVSATLIHYIQRGYVKIVENIKAINGSHITFFDGKSGKFDAIVLCTGYDINLDFLEESLRDKVLNRGDKNDLNLYKSVFCPQLRDRMGFIGFVQPTSGGIIMCSEIQVQWFIALLNEFTTLPDEVSMRETIAKDKAKSRSRFYSSPRHTIQVDPIIYCDAISEKFGGKPSLIKHLSILPKLLFASCGPSQYRLQGPFRLCPDGKRVTEGAREMINKIPVPPLNKLFGGGAIIVVFILQMLLLGIWTFCT